MKAGEWFEWENVPLNGTPHFLIRVATTTATATMHLVIDGVAQTSKTLPDTGGDQTWTTFDAGAVGTYPSSYHTVRIVFDNANNNVNFNWWQVSSGGIINGGTYHLVCEKSGMALDNGGSTTKGTSVTQYTDIAGNSNQEWKLVSVGSGYYNLICQKSGMALDNGGSTMKGTVVTQYTVASGNINQYWSFVDVGGGFYNLVCEKSGMVLDNGGSTTKGADVTQYTGRIGQHQPILEIGIRALKTLRYVRLKLAGHGQF